MNTSSYDYLVVGAGSAGSVVAARLAADPRARVAVIEAGGPDDHPAVGIPLAFPTLFGTEHDWDYRTTPQPGLAGREVRVPRGRILGGSSSLNANVWTRGHRADFDGWAQGGAPGWTYDDVEPYFRRAERRTGTTGPGLYGTDGPQYVEDVRSRLEVTDVFLAACDELGLPRSADANAPDSTGVARLPTSQRDGRRWSTADGYLRGLGRENLDVRSGLHVRRILVEDGRATGVEAADREGRVVTLLARREVILSAGAINSPQLLMLSGIGPAEHLAEHGIDCVRPLDGVGQGLQDHLFAPLIVHCRREVTLAAAGSPEAQAAYERDRTGPLTSNVAEAAYFAASSPGHAAPDLEISFLPAAFVDHGIDPPAEHALTLAVVLLQPRSRGRVRLRSSSPDDAPEIDPGYLLDPAGEDLRRLIRGLAVARRILGTHALAPYAGEPWHPDLDLDDEASVEHHVRHRADTVYHHVGTCRMGTDEEAVVDPELRVRGIDGLRVVDASAMPVIPRAHTNAATIMLAERAADLIRGA
ncbi:choline dehydrogenase [Actinoplanes sp. NBRC 14428]|nr:choline dehydrogenase [Actinoplanes sp. NBRC 14428]